MTLLIKSKLKQITFIFISLLLAGTVISKTNKLKQQDESSFKSEVNSFLNNKNNTSDIEINTEDLSSYASICYNMLKPIVDSLPNDLKEEYFKHIKQYASEYACGKSEIFADSIKNFFKKNTDGLSQILTNASKGAKEGLGCFNSAGIVKNIIRDSYDESLSKSKSLQKFRSTIDLMSKNLYTKAILARSALTEEEKQNSSFFLQLSKEEKAKVLFSKEEEEIKKNTINFLQTHQSNITSLQFTASETEAYLKASFGLDESNLDKDLADSKKVSSKIINNMLDLTNSINFNLIKCLLKLQFISFLRTLNLVGSHKYIDKVFDKDIAYAKKVLLSKQAQINLVTGASQNTNEYYVVNSDVARAAYSDDVTVIDLSTLSPKENVYVSHKNDKKINIDIGKSCFNYINNYGYIKNNLLSQFVDQCNQIIGLEECNYYGNMFYYNEKTDLIDQTYINNMSSAFSLEKSKSIIDKKIGLEKSNFEFLSSVVNTFNQTSKDISTKWESCMRNKNVANEKIDDFLKKIELSKQNFYGLSTMIGRCTVNYDKIKNDFSSYYIDFYIECKHQTCKAFCNECNRWDGSGVVLDDDVELDVSCCDNYCGVVIKERIPIKNGEKKEFFGGEWYYLISAEQSIPTTPLLKLKVETAFEIFKKENEIQRKLDGNLSQSSNFIQQTQNKREAFQDVNTSSNIKHYTNNYLMKKIKNFLEKGSINSNNVITSISNKFQLLTALNLKIGNYTIEEFINKQLINSKKGGYISCFNGKCLSECDNKDCGLYDISNNHDFSTMILPPDSRRSTISQANYDSSDVFNKGSSKYTSKLFGLSLHETEYQEKCILNKEKLGEWSTGYDLIRIKSASEDSSNSAFSTTIDSNTEEIKRKEAYENFYKKLDMSMNNFLYNKESLIEEDRLYEDSIFRGYEAYYLKNGVYNVIRDSLSIKAKLNLGNDSLHYIRTSTVDFKKIEKNELSSQFNPDDLRPSYLREVSTDTRIKFINTNKDNFEIDVQCNGINCVLIIENALDGTNYIDYYQKKIPIYDSNKLSSDQKICFAKELINYKTQNPLYHQDRFNSNEYSNILNEDNPFKDTQNEEDANEIIRKINERLGLTGNNTSTDTNFLQKSMGKSKKNEVFSLSSIKNKVTSKKNKQVVITPNSQTTSSSTKPSTSNDYTLNIDGKCNITNSPYPIFPIKPACIREFTYTCTQADLIKTVERFNLFESCKEILECKGLNPDSSDEEFEKCGSVLQDSLFKRSYVSINYSHVIFPCDASEYYSAYELNNIRKSRGFIDKSSLSMEENSQLETNIEKSLINTPGSMEVDGSTEKFQASDYTKLDETNGELSFYYGSISKYLSTSILVLFTFVFVLV